MQHPNMWHSQKVCDRDVLNTLHKHIDVPNTMI